jgi:calnexin
VFPGLAGDTGLVAKSKAAQHAISAQFPEVIDAKAAALEGKPLVIQYEVKLQNGLSCGGAYMKLLTEGAEGIHSKEFSDKTPYTIMFGPDKCGGTNKVHFIFRHKNPVSGEIEEKHLQYPPYAKIAKTSTLYTLIVRPDNTFDVLINNESKKNGTLLESFEPAVNPEKQIDDPSDSKPADWVDTARITDKSAVKPSDWDEDAPAEIIDPEAVKPEGWLENEPLLVTDPEAVKPEEWDDEEDGEWVAPTIPNPKCEDAPGCGPWNAPTIRNPEYKGKWTAPLVDNPAYKGEWAPRKIDNPAYFEDLNPNHFSRIAGIGFEIWTMDEDILFDNIYVGYSEEDARELARQTFDVKFALEQNLEKEDEKKADSEKAGADLPLLGFSGMREKLLAFFDAAKRDPIAAVKEMPSVASLAAVILTGIIGLFGFVGGIMGSASKSPPKKAVKPAKKVDEPSTAKTTSVAPKESATKKRSTVATAKDEDDE